MRKVAFIEIDDECRKVMIHETSDGVFLFGYDCLQDASAKSDNWFSTVSDAEQYCQDAYNLSSSDWINIADPMKDCQQDFIIPTRVKANVIGKPIYGTFESLKNGEWIEEDMGNNLLSLAGLPGVERLTLTGLIDEFNLAMLINKEKAVQIGIALKFDINSIETVIKV